MAPPSQMSLSRPAGFQDYSGSQDRQYLMPATQPDDFAAHQSMSCSQPYMDYVKHTPVRAPVQRQPRSAGLPQPHSTVSRSPAHQQGMSQSLPQAAQYVMHGQHPQQQPSPGYLRQTQQDQTVLHRPFQPARSSPAAPSQLQVPRSSQPFHQIALTQPSQDTFPDETQADPPTFAVSSSTVPASQQLAVIPHHRQAVSTAISEQETPDTAATPSSGHNPSRLLMKIKSRAAAAAISNAATAPLAAVMQDTATSPLVFPNTSCAQQTDATAESVPLSTEAAEQLQQAVAAAEAAQHECKTLAAVAIAACNNIAAQDDMQAATKAGLSAAVKACVDLNTALERLHDASDLHSSRLSSVEASCHSMLEAVQSLAANTKTGFAALSAQQAAQFSKPVPLSLEQFTQTAATGSQHAQAVQAELPLLSRHQAIDKACSLTAHTTVGMSVVMYLSVC